LLWGAPKEGAPPVPPGPVETTPISEPSEV
jgi:hypothetical protein